MKSSSKVRNVAFVLLLAAALGLSNVARSYARGGGGFGTARNFGGGGDSGFHFGGDGFGGGDPSHNSWSQSSSYHPQSSSGSSSYESQPSGGYNYSSGTSGEHPNQQSAQSYEQFNKEHPNSNMSYGQYNQASNNYNRYKSEHPTNTDDSNTYNSNSSYPSGNAYHPYGSTPQQAAYNMNQQRYNEAESLQHQQYANQSNLNNQKYNEAYNLQNNSSGNYNPYGGCCRSSGGSEASAAAVGMVGGMAMGAAIESAAQPRQPTTVVEEVGVPAPAPAPLPIGSTVPMLPTGATPTQINGQYFYFYNGSYYSLHSTEAR